MYVTNVCDCASLSLSLSPSLCVLCTACVCIPKRDNLWWCTAAMCYCSSSTAMCYCSSSTPPPPPGGCRVASTRCTSLVHIYSVFMLLTFVCILCTCVCVCVCMYGRMRVYVYACIYTYVWYREIRLHMAEAKRRHATKARLLRAQQALRAVYQHNLFQFLIALLILANFVLTVGRCVAVVRTVGGRRPNLGCESTGYLVGLFGRAL